MVVMDWSGIAILVAALAAAFVSVGTFIRAGRLETKTTEIHALTNNNYSELNRRLDEAISEIARLGRAAADEAVASRSERETITGLAVEQARAAAPIPPFDEGLEP